MYIRRRNFNVLDSNGNRLVTPSDTPEPPVRTLIIRRYTRRYGARNKNVPVFIQLIGAAWLVWHVRPRGAPIGLAGSCNRAHIDELPLARPSPLLGRCALRFEQPRVELFARVRVRVVQTPAGT